MIKIKKITAFSLIILLCISIVGCGNRIDVSLQSVESNIDVDRVYKHIEVLSSKEYDGRFVGGVGNEKTVEYIQKEFQKMGLLSHKDTPDYIQEFSQDVYTLDSKPVLSIRDKSTNNVVEFTYLKDYTFLNNINRYRVNGEETTDLVYIDDKDKLNDLTYDIANKTVLISDELLKEYDSDIYKITSGLDKISKDYKALIYERDRQTDGYFPVIPASNFRKHMSVEKEDRVFTIACNTKTFVNLVEACTEGKELKISVNYSHKKYKSKNVIGYIEGSDSKLKNEYVIIGAHLDHVGSNLDGTYNPGALDNASGVASILEIAHNIVNSKVKPKKTIIFIAFNGEEEGLLGSTHYVYNPIFSLNKAVMINIDCVATKDSRALLYSIASNKSKKFRNMFDKYDFVLDTPKSDYESSSSDHKPFDMANVPSIFFIHENAWSFIHTPNDTVENSIDKDLLDDVVNLVLHYLDDAAY